MASEQPTPMETRMEAIPEPKEVAPEVCRSCYCELNVTFLKAGACEIKLKEAPPLGHYRKHNNKSTW